MVGAVAAREVPKESSAVSGGQFVEREDKDLVWRQVLLRCAVEVVVPHSRFERELGERVVFVSPEVARGDGQFP